MAFIAKRRVKGTQSINSLSVLYITFKLQFAEETFVARSGSDTSKLV